MLELTFEKVPNGAGVGISQNGQAGKENLKDTVTGEN